jgi:hypothetical protein
MLQWGDQSLFIERRFTAAESWNRYSADDGFRFRGVFRDREPKLQTILQHARILILGEPGSGKSTIIKAVVYRLAAEGLRAPVPALLKSYRGNLVTLLKTNTPAEILDDANLKRTYVLDGLDEIPSNFLTQFTSDISALVSSDQDARFVITSRQAFHAKNPAVLQFESKIVHILEFGDSDVRRFVQFLGVSSDEFAKAVTDARCNEEVRNPFILGVMVERYKELGRLSPLRFENVSYMIDRLIGTRNFITARLQRRALRMLGTACETYSRNELTDDEALRVLLEAIDLPETDARQILDELSHSILIRTSNGIAFQMRSYGEFLAAEELETQPLDRVKDLAFHDDDTPNESWMNAISYLAEVNSTVRKYFTRNHPEWMFAASPDAFPEAERTALCSAFINGLNRNGELILDHPIVRPIRVAQFITPPVLENLLSKLSSTNPAEAANAVALAGVMGRKEIVPFALAIAKETQRADPLRSAAIIALVNSADYRAIDELIAVLKPDDTFHISLADVIGSLARHQDIPKVMPILTRTNAMLSAAYYHFREFHSREAVYVTLEYLHDNPREFEARRVDAYLDPIIEQIPEFWDERLEKISANIIITLDGRHIYPESHNLIQKFLTAIHDTRKTDGLVKLVLTHFVAIAKPPTFYSEAIANLLTLNAAKWVASFAGPELISRLARSIGDPNIRAILAPASGGFIEAQDKYSEEYAKEESEKAKRRKSDLEEHHSMIARSHNFAEVVTHFYGLDKADWPDLEPARSEWIASEISKNLLAFDLENNITHEGSSWTTPTWLNPLLEIIGHYGLRLPVDTTLVQALRAWPERSIIDYYKKHGFSDAANDLVKALLSSTDLNPHVISNILSFMVSAEYRCEDLIENLQRLALGNTQATYARRHAIELIAKVPGTETVLDDVRKKSDDKDVSKVAFNTLVDRQHRGTIEAALSKLLSDDNEIKAGESQLPDISPLDWLGRIREKFAWAKLVRLRSKTLALALPNLSQVVTVALKKVDAYRVAKVIKDQLPQTPSAWRRGMIKLASEYQREARQARIRSTPFEAILAKLKGSTSMIALKVFCEGPSDRPAFRSLFLDLGEVRIAETLDYVAGWPNLVKEEEPDRWLDGCRRAVIIMDGDEGRDFSKSKRPESALAKKARKRLSGKAIKLYVLRRYGIENYFPKSNCEAVLGRDLSTFFPIPETQSVEAHFVDRTTGVRFFFKSQHTESIGKQLKIADIAGTDLEGILLKVVQEARNISPD